MGIKQLHKLLRPMAQTRYQIDRSWSGKRVGVDAMCWMHRGAVACAYELLLGKETDKFVRFFMDMVFMLLWNGIIPIIIFDGQDLPAKQEEASKRRQEREEARDKVLDASRKLGDGRAALDINVQKNATKAIKISVEMIERILAALRELNIEFMVAPYESDAQLAYLCRIGYLHAVISEDSDLFVYGCPRVLCKVDKHGEGELFELESIVGVGNKREVPELIQKSVDTVLDAGSAVSAEYSSLQEEGIVEGVLDGTWTKPSGEIVLAEENEGMSGDADAALGDVEDAAGDEAEDDADAMEKDLFGDEDLTTAKADADEVVEVLEPVRERGPQSYSSAPSSSRTAEGDVAEDDGVVAVGAVATSSTTSSASGSANQKRPLPEQISDSEYEREQERRKKVTRSGVEDNAAGVIVLDDDDDAEVEAKDPTEHMEDGKQEGEDVAGEEDALVEEEIRDPERGKSVFDIIEEEEAQKKAAKKKRPKAKAAKPKKEPKPKKETKKKEPKRPPKPKKEAVKRPEAKVPNLKFDLSLMKTWTWDMFRTFAVLSGCDYTVHVHVKGLAIGTAAKLVHCFKERALDVVVKKFPLPCAPKAFVEALHLALSVFRHHIVFDKKRGDLLHFSEALRRCRRLGIESADPEVIQSLPGCSDRTRACGDLRKLDLRRMPALCAGELRPKTMEPRPKDPLNQAEKKMLKYLRERKNKNMRMHMKHVANAAEAKGKEEVVLEHQGPVPEEHVFSFTPPGGIMRPAEPRNDTSFGAIHTGFSTPTKHSPSLTFQDELAAMRAWYAEGQKIEQQVQEERDFIQENAADLLQVPPLVGDVLELNKENLLPKENKTTSTSAVSSSSSTTLHCGNGAIKLSSTTTSVNKSGARGAVTSTTATTNNTTMTLRANSRSLYIPEPQPTTATENVGATSLASATVRQNPFRRRGAGPRQAPTTGGTSSSMLMNTASSTTGAAPGSSSTGQARVDAFLGQLRDPKKYDEEKHNPGLDKFHKKKNPLGGMFF